MSVSKQALLQSLLAEGITLTKNQIRTNLGLRNPYAAISVARKRGMCIYTNPTGYRLGTPTASMMSVMVDIFGANGLGLNRSKRS